MEETKKKRVYVEAWPPLDRCNGCEKCVKACPHDVLLPYPGQDIVFAHNWLNCDACGNCLEVCEQDAIKLVETPATPTKREVYYFDEAWPPVHTEKVIEIVKQRLTQTNLKHVVVTSTSGSTALKFAEALGKKAHIICVTGTETWEDYGYTYPLIKEKVRTQLESYNVDIVNTVQEPLGSDIIFRNWWKRETIPMEGKQADLFWMTLLCVGGNGLRTAVEGVFMAVEDGKVPKGDDVIAVAGRATGANTAIIVKATRFKEAVGTDIAKRFAIREILAMPRKRRWYR